jgi:NAD(P)-dependent dehydrogenase (short-subunit alcohol dehydrogenase family)/aryl carrier-like protein
VDFPVPGASDDELFDAAQAVGVNSLLSLAQALAGGTNGEPLHVTVLSNNMHDVTGREGARPAQSTLAAACLVMQQEHPNLRCRSIDLDASDARDLSGERLPRQLRADLDAEGGELLVAYRGRPRWVQDFEPLPPAAGGAAPPALREEGLYLITGGLGGVGGVLAEHLAREARARLVLVGRTALPDREAWDAWLSAHDEGDKTSVKIGLVRRLEALGARVIPATADVADEPGMGRVVAQAEAQFGPLRGVIHAAGAAGEEAIRAIPQLDRQECERQFRPKVRGLHVLSRVLRGREPDFCMLVSSISSVLGGIGHAAYAAANLYLDAFARRESRDSEHWLSVDWDVWQLTREKEETFSYKGNTAFGASVSGLALSAEEGSKVFGYLLARGVRTQALISTGDLQARIDQWVKLDFLRDAQATPAAAELHARPALGVGYVAPDSDTEMTVARVWQEVLGIGQVGVHDNFFELGGNSLLGLKVVARLKKECGIDVPVVALFEGPTVLALSKLLSAGATGEESYERSRGRGARRLERRQRMLELTRSE